MKRKTSHTRNLVNRSPCNGGIVAVIVIALALSCFALSPQASADCQQGCDSNYVSTFLGDGALVNSTTGTYNTAIGAQALSGNTTGFQNTANGALTLTGNTIGINNTGNGFQALSSNTSGSNNTAVGSGTLLSNTTGFRNTANGFSALSSNTIGGSNTADGSNALFNNTSGLQNTANGVGALFNNTTGSNNTASGFNALFGNSTGSNNIAIGVSAGINLITGSNNIDIGNSGMAADSDKIRIGTRGTHTRAFIAGISGATVPGGVGVIVGNNGQLGTVVSSERFKDAIKPMDKASEAILALKPVTFRYKKELDPESIPQFGLVAEQVEKIDPDLVARDEEGKPYTVRYEAVNAMLLNEFLKEHRTVQLQQKEIDALKAELKEQRALIQRVNDKVETSKSSPQIVLNNQ